MKIKYKDGTSQLLQFSTLSFPSLVSLNKEKLLFSKLAQKLLGTLKWPETVTGIPISHMKKMKLQKYHKKERIHQILLRLSNL